MSTLFYKNSIRTQEKILSELNYSPLNVGDGYVYCFKPVNFVNTQTNFKLKIGRTGRTAEERITEQNGMSRFSIYSIFWFKLERMCHLFFRFANVRSISDGNEMFLFRKKYNIEMNDVFLYINMMDVLLKNTFIIYTTL